MDVDDTGKNAVAEEKTNVIIAEITGETEMRAACFNNQTSLAESSQVLRMDHGSA